MPVEKKLDLTPEERIQAAFLHFVRGYEMQSIAYDFFRGVNIGRVSEACGLIWKAAQDTAIQRRRRITRKTFTQKPAKKAAKKTGAKSTTRRVR